MPIKKRSIDIVQPKYHPSAKPDEAASALSSSDVVMLLEKSKRSRTELADGTLVPQPDVSPTAEEPGAPEAKPRGWRALKVIVGLVALIAAVYFGVQAGSRLFDAWADLKPVSSKSDSTNTATTPEESATTTPTATTTTETPAAAPVATPAPAATPAAAPITVKVLNGNGRAGDATKVKAVLEAASITVAATGNAKTFGYATTIVYYVSGKKEAADKVVAALTGYSASTVENAVADGYDALVVIGAK